MIYTGLFQTPEQIAETTLQEDADAVGLSVLSGAHLTLFPKVVELLAERVAATSWSSAAASSRTTTSPRWPTRRRPDVHAGAPLADVTGWLETALDEREARVAG